MRFQEVRVNRIYEGLGVGIRVGINGLGRSRPPILLRICYAEPGTDAAYATTSYVDNEIYRWRSRCCPAHGQFGVWY